MKKYLCIMKNLIESYFLMITRKTIILDTPLHGNIGDQAITLAEYQILKQCGVKYGDIPGAKISGKEWLLALLTPSSKQILINGGGFMGCLWLGEEYRFRRILKAFSRQHVTVFPQTVTFDLETEEGRAFFEESKAIYCAHPHLTVFVREQKSYDFMQKYMPEVKTILVPDVVTVLESHIKAGKRKGILLCMRNDLEKTCSDEIQQSILEALHNQYPEEEVAFTDTVIDHGVSMKKREEEVNNKLMEFANAKLVITDRLHGMVLAAITGTPCIALTNSNGKVKGVYQWIQSNSYVRYLDDFSQFGDVLKELNLEASYQYDASVPQKSMLPLIEHLQKLK